MLMVGGSLFVAGLVLTSHVESLALGYVTYGVGVGIGGGCFVAPLTALIGQMFLVRRTLALGVVAAGNGLGTLILTPLSDRLIDANGWRSAYQTLAVIGAVIVVVSVVAVWVRVDPAAVGGPRPVRRRAVRTRSSPTAGSRRCSRRRC